MGLHTVEERIKRGHDNGLLHLAHVSQRVRDCAKNVPGIEELRKRNEDKSQSQWERFLLKHHGLMKKQQQIEKAQKEEERARKQRNEDHMSLIRQKLRFNALEEREKHREMNRKFESIDRKIEQSKERKKLYTIKHRELENLKIGDF